MSNHDGHDHGALIGPVLDGLGVKMCLGEHDQVTDVLVISRVINADTGHTALGVTHNGLDWITKAGLLAAAHQAETVNAAYAFGADEDDD